MMREMILNMTTDDHYGDIVYIGKDIDLCFRKRPPPYEHSKQVIISINAPREVPIKRTNNKNGSKPEAK